MRLSASYMPGKCKKPSSLNQRQYSYFKHSLGQQIITMNFIIYCVKSFDLMNKLWKVIVDGAHAFKAVLSAFI